MLLAQQARKQRTARSASSRPPRARAAGGGRQAGRAGGQPSKQPPSTRPGEVTKQRKHNNSAASSSWVGAMHRGAGEGAKQERPSERPRRCRSKLSIGGATQPGAMAGQAAQCQQDATANHRQSDYNGRKMRKKYTSRSNQNLHSFCFASTYWLAMAVRCLVICLASLLRDKHWLARSRSLQQ